VDIGNADDPGGAMSTARDRSSAKVIAVVGPTAAGKSDLAVTLAEHLGGAGRAEIINADSMQLYEGMNIGTAKLSVAQRRGITHHLLDVWPLAKSAAVAEYQSMARAAIDDVHRRGLVPILVGGSGLYVRATLDQLVFPGESSEIRTRLYAELDQVGPAALHDRLARLDPAAGRSILVGNGRRIVRALEVIELTGEPFTARMPDFEYIYDAVQIGVERADVDERVDRRVELMMAAGLLDEVRALLLHGLRQSPTAGKALGYAQLLAILDDDGRVIGDLVEAVAVTKRATRRFVRRQRSWFRRDPRIHWLDAQAPDLRAQAIAKLPLTLAP
jgi:tRNA dimethylallyltransferase